MSDITYKKFSELTRVNTLQTEDIIPIAQFVSGTIYNSRSISLSTLYNQTSAALITPFTTSIQTTVNSSLSSDKWNSTYSTVQTNSASWSATTDTLTAFIQGTTASVRFLSASINDASVALVATGIGATLAQVPNNATSGGNNRGSWSTDWQKLRGGATQVASGSFSVIGGGGSNTADNTASTVAGGVSNHASGQYSTIGGGYTNIASSEDATVGGGDFNTASGQNSTIGGGSRNITSGLYTTIGGGRILSATGNYSTIAGGLCSLAFGYATTIGGGVDNKSLSAYNVIGGGHLNTTSGEYSTIAGGYTNTASGSASSILGGINNNTNSKTNAHIIGSNITAPSENYTYVNNLSTPGSIISNSALFTTLTATTTTSSTVSAATYRGPAAIRAWANFNGVGTGAGAVTIRDSYNINKIARISEGIFNIEFTTNTFTTSSYVVMGTASGNIGALVIIKTATETAAPTVMTPLSCQIEVNASNNGTSEVRQSNVVCVSFLGS
jgi:hypothetical protein